MAQGLERTSAGGNGGAAGTVAEVPARDPAAGTGAGQVPAGPAGLAAVSPAANGATPGQPGEGQPAAGRPGQAR